MLLLFLGQEDYFSLRYNATTGRKYSLLFLLYGGPERASRRLTGHVQDAHPRGTAAGEGQDEQLGGVHHTHLRQKAASLQPVGMTL
jgi:hypothetical protein